MKTELIVANAPKLTTGDDAAIGKQLVRLFNDAQNGMRRVVAFGLLAWEVKLKVKHGQFGPWLAEHAPKLCRKDSATGSPKTTHALESYMALTKGVLETCGLTVGKYLGTVMNSPGSGNLGMGRLLLLPEKKVPQEFRSLREKICSTVDGKTQKQLQLEFKQMEEDGSGELKKKHGRLKGKGGASAAQRAAAKAALLEAEAQSANEWAEEAGATIRELADDAHWGKTLTDANAEKLLEDLQTGVDYLNQLVKARSKAKA